MKGVKSLMGKNFKHPDLHCGLEKKQMLALTGKYADGYVAKGGESIVSVKQIVSSIKSAAEKANRSLAQIDFGAYLLTLVDKSK